MDSPAVDGRRYSARFSSVAGVGNASSAVIARDAEAGRRVITRTADPGRVRTPATADLGLCLGSRADPFDLEWLLAGEGISSRAADRADRAEACDRCDGALAGRDDA